MELQIELKRLEIEELKLKKFKYVKKNKHILWKNMIMKYYDKLN